MVQVAPAAQCGAKSLPSSSHNLSAPPVMTLAAAAVLLLLLLLLPLSVLLGCWPALLLAVADAVLGDDAEAAAAPTGATAW